MKMFRKILQGAFAIAIAAGCGVIGDELGVPGFSGVTSEAYAVVGRPLTPVSVAGVARRTTRRCAAGVYNC